MELIKVVEECHVTPPPGSVPNTSLPLTFFDILLLTAPPVQYLYFYESHNPDTNHLLPNIKHSLSLTLQHFYPLAGNFTWPQGSIKPEITYEGGDYVSLTVAESAHNFYQLSDNKRRDAIDSTPLTPKFTTTTKGAPVLALQVTFFPNQGICIGVIVSHAAVDGRTRNHFMKTWASFCRLQEANTSLLADGSYPFYDRSSLSYLRPIELAFLNHMVTKDNFLTLNPHHEDPVDKISGTFVMGVSDIEKLKQSASSHFEKLQGEKPTFHFSSFVVTCAYIWSCFVKARCGESGSDVNEAAPEHLTVTVDARERLDPPLPLTYFGNCLSGVPVTIKRSELIGKDGVALAAILIRTSITNLDVVAQTRKEGEMGKFLACYTTFMPEHVLTVASSPKFGVYETDFGWGKPKRVEMSSIHIGQTISLNDCPNEVGAIEIGVVRSKKEMDAFVHHFENSLNNLS